MRSGEWGVGSGEWGVGSGRDEQDERDERDEGDEKEELITNVQFPMPNSLLPTPYSPLPIL
ncbi:MAG: hypothetical protein V7L04_13500 [Nostoc sp.]|uniref:hypothetical protein n=1 Tax=Nostoc sp. TaxID=1180 RepID=UPI002FF5B329